MRLPVAALAALLLAAPVALAPARPALAQQGEMGDLSGLYNARGTNPGGGSGYSATVTIRRSGEIWLVNWQIGNERYEGVGIVTNGVLSVAVPSAGQVAAYHQTRPGVLEGRWAIPNQQQMGSETLTKR